MCGQLWTLGTFFGNKDLIVPTEEFLMISHDNIVLICAWLVGTQGRRFGVRFGRDGDRVEVLHF